MPSIIHDLYFGKLSPWEQLRPTPEQREQYDQLRRLEEQLSVDFDESQKRLFLKIIDAYSTIHGGQQTDSFTQGFRLGAQLMMAVATTG